MLIARCAEPEAPWRPDRRRRSLTVVRVCYRANRRADVHLADSGIAGAPGGPGPRGAARPANRRM